MSAIWLSIEGSDEMEEWSEVSVESSMDNIYEFKSRSEASWIGQVCQYAKGLLIFSQR